MTDDGHQSAKRSDWLFDVERLKGLAIILVAWGHVYHPNFPESALVLRRFIYSFHMPLFMFLSGYVFIHTRAHMLRVPIGTYVSKRFRRILVPFFAMALIIILGKFIFQNIMEVRSPVSGFSGAIMPLFIHTEDSPVFFIWYLAVLFYFTIFTMFAFSKLKISIHVLFLISLLLYALHIVLFNNKIILDYFYFNRVLMFYAAFMGGCMACHYKEQWLSFVDRFWILMIGPFALLSYALYSNEWRYLVVGFAATPVFLGLVRSRLFANDRILLFFGTNAFAIYLLNMPFIGLTQGLMGKIMSPAVYGYVIILTCVFAGLCGPILVKRTLAYFEKSRPIAAAME